MTNSNLLIGMDNMPNPSEIATNINHDTKTLTFSYQGIENTFSFDEYEEWLPVKLGSKEVHCEIFFDETLRITLYPYMKRKSPAPDLPPYEIDSSDGIDLVFTEVGSK